MHLCAEDALLVRTLKKWNESFGFVYLVSLNLIFSGMCKMNNISFSKTFIAHKDPLVE